MPTAQDTAYLIEVMPADATTQNFLSRDVDLLVSQIKENLRLTGLKAKKSSVVQGNRSTPYRVPSRSWADPDGCGICAANNLTEKSNELRLQPELDPQCHPQLRQQHHQHQSYQQCYHRNNHFHRHPHHRHNHHLHNHHRHHHHHHHHLHHRGRCPNNGREGDDPYELLQELLREGSLIKEAVKRLQANLDELERSEDDEIEDDDDEEDEAEEEEDDDNEEEEDDLSNGMVLNRSGAKERSRIYRRKPYFYDSEEESLSSVYEPLEL